MSKLVEAASEFLGRDTFNKGNHRDFSEAMCPTTKKMEAKVPAGMHRMPDGKLMKDSDMPGKNVKKEMEESFLLSQEEFHSLSEDDQEQYVNQLMELKKAALEAMNGMNGKRNGMLMSGMNKMNGMKEMDAKKMKEMRAMKEMDKMKMKRM